MNLKVFKLSDQERMWDVNSATSWYLSTDFIVSDEKGGLGKMLIEKRTRHVGLYLVVLTALSVKLYNNRLYLSRTSSTMIVDDKQIPVLKQFKSDDSGIEIAKELLLADSTGVKAGTLENLLMWVHNQKYDGNLDRKHGCFWCDSCHNSIDYPVLRLELEVSDNTTQTVVVMFDETARAVVKCSAEEALDESGSSRTLAGIGEPKTSVLVPLSITPSVKERHNSDGEESFVADSKTKRSDVGCSSGIGKRRRLVQDGSK
nr:hypothetical protein [Tanacetum cinerariifolium]